jgi:diaminopimelate decarboxylase
VPAWPQEFDAVLRSGCGPEADELLRVHGTPTYVYRLDEVRRAVARLSAILPEGVRIYYSVKANPHPLLIAEAARAGARVEVSSTGELGAARAAGVSAANCLYTGPGKTAAELEYATRSGVRAFSVESLTDRDRLAGTARSAVDYLVRLNMAGSRSPSGLRMTGAPSQFGVDWTELERTPELLEPREGADPAGFHLFSATNIGDGAALAAELTGNVAAAAQAARRFGFAPRVVDIGGGFGAPYMVPGEPVDYPGLREALAAALDRSFPGWRAGEPAIAVEAGRYLMAAAGTLLTTVLDVKTSGSATYVVCDAGVNVLGGMYGIGRLVAPKAQPSGHGDGEETVQLVGPLCTPLDVLNRTARLDRPRVGQVLEIPNVGAYGLSASLVGFLGRELPAELVLDGDQVVDLRRLELRARKLALTGEGTDAGH